VQNDQTGLQESDKWHKSSTCYVLIIPSAAVRSSDITGVSRREAEMLGMLNSTPSLELLQRYIGVTSFLATVR